MGLQGSEVMREREERCERRISMTGGGRCSCESMGRLWAGVRREGVEMMQGVRCEQEGEIRGRVEDLVAVQVVV